MSEMVEEEVKCMLEGALTAAADVVTSNRNVHEGLSNNLEKEERVGGDDLRTWLSHIEIPSSLTEFVLNGTLPSTGGASQT